MCESNTQHYLEKWWAYALYFFILYVIIIWCDSTVCHCIAEYTTNDYCNVWFGMIVQYDKSRYLWICCIAQYTKNVNHLYVQCIYAIRYMDL